MNEHILYLNEVLKAKGISMEFIQTTNNDVINISLLKPGQPPRQVYTGNDANLVVEMCQTAAMIFS